ncbi:MAG: aminopeptidase [Bacilli bacterium]|nr:aminopeptidase [Bacilli bacterium]
MNEVLIEKFAKVIVDKGVALQDGQMLVINAPLEAATLVKYIVKEAYLKNSKKVMVNFSDAEVNKQEQLYASQETLNELPDWAVARAHYIVDNGAASLSITSPKPGIMAGVDPMRMQIASRAIMPKMKFFRKYTMENEGQWCVVACPNEIWAKKVFPDLEVAEATEKLWEAILNASRVTLDNDPVAEWNEHNKALSSRNEILNNYNFVSLHFKNSLGTDLEIGLVENHIWAGGGEHSKKGVYFNPNIPTEENFCMPHNKKINGRVVATMPLNYSGKLIEDFYLDFKDGKVVAYDAKKELDALKSLIEFDEGSSSLGEVALISHNSPISNMNILFYNTLFDENASCHLALGASYTTTNLKDAEKYTEAELDALGSNQSNTHVDFMFGSSDMEVTGLTHDGKVVQIFKNGNFVF